MSTYFILIIPMCYQFLNIPVDASDGPQKRFPMYQMHQWSQWSSCSNPCGYGVYTRHRGCRAGLVEIPVCPYRGHEEYPCYGRYCPTRPVNRPSTHRHYHHHQMSGETSTAQQHYTPSNMVSTEKITHPSHPQPVIDHNHLTYTGMATPSPPSPPLSVVTNSNQMTQHGIVTPPSHLMINSNHLMQNGMINVPPTITPPLAGVTHGYQITMTGMATPPPPSPPLSVVTNSNQMTQHGIVTPPSNLMINSNHLMQNGMINVPPTITPPSAGVTHGYQITMTGMATPSPPSPTQYVSLSFAIPTLTHMAPTAKPTKKQWITLPSSK